jgi:hypothetical protein
MGLHGAAIYSERGRPINDRVRRAARGESKEPRDDHE